MHERPTPPELVGQSKVFLDALDHASEVAAIDRSVLIAGERGSGKELFATRIHFLSPRWDRPLVKVNCAALNDELLESELFGHEAGAFTGAQKRRLGRFDRAEGGTLFLDEIASASPRIQEKLLRVIEYGEYERVGGEQTLQADVRVLAATNVDLRPLSESNAFRADLLDRLSFDVVAAPPLRARAEDIGVLAGYFARNFCAEINEPFAGFSPSAITQMHAYRWPGNVRELKNTTERSVHRHLQTGSAGPVEAIEFDPFEKAFGKDQPSREAHQKSQAAPDHQRPIPNDLRVYLNTEERRIVEAALAQNNFNQKKTAAQLSLTYDQLRGVIRKHEIAVN